MTPARRESRKPTLHGDLRYTTTLSDGLLTAAFAFEVVILMFVPCALLV